MPKSFFKVSTKLAQKLKKSSKIRGITLSDLIRNTLENLYDKTGKTQEVEPKIFSYFGIFDENDEQWQTVKDSIEEGKKDYEFRDVKF